MSIRSRLVSQSNDLLISNSDQSINATDLSPITFGEILPPRLCGIISTNSQINLVNLDDNKRSKVRTIKIFLDNGASASIIPKHVFYERHKILKDERINGQLWQGPLILPLQ